MHKTFQTLFNIDFFFSFTRLLFSSFVQMWIFRWYKTWRCGAPTIFRAFFIRGKKTYLTFRNCNVRAKVSSVANGRIRIEFHECCFSGFSQHMADKNVLVVRQFSWFEQTRTHIFIEYRTTLGREFIFDFNIDTTPDRQTMLYSIVVFFVSSSKVKMIFLEKSHFDFVFIVFNELYRVHKCECLPIGKSKCQFDCCRFCNNDKVIVWFLYFILFIFLSKSSLPLRRWFAIPNFRFKSEFFSYFSI